jgi:hypothetical protein
METYRDALLGGAESDGSIMRRSNGGMGSVQPGAHVYTRDGDHLGTVGEVRGDAFKVSASMQPDYWLDMDCIAQVSGDHVTLGLDRHELSRAGAAESERSEPLLDIHPHVGQTTIPTGDAQNRAAANAPSAAGTIREQRDMYEPTEVPVGTSGFTGEEWSEPLADANNWDRYTPSERRLEGNR